MKSANEKQAVSKFCEVCAAPLAKLTDKLYAMAEQASLFYNAVDYDNREASGKITVEMEKLIARMDSESTQYRQLTSRQLWEMRTIQPLRRLWPDDMKGIAELQQKAHATICQKRRAAIHRGSDVGEQVRPQQKVVVGDEPKSLPAARKVISNLAKENHDLKKLVAEMQEYKARATTAERELRKANRELAKLRQMTATKSKRAA